MQAGDALGAMSDYLIHLLERKDRDPGDDLFSELAIKRVRTGELTREQAAGMGTLLLIAGHETTANMIGLSTVSLLRDPAQRDRLLAEPELVPGRSRNCCATCRSCTSGCAGSWSRTSRSAGHAPRGRRRGDPDPVRQPRPERLRHPRPARPEPQRPPPRGVRLRIHQCLGSRWPARSCRSRCPRCSAASRTWPSRCRSRRSPSRRTPPSTASGNCRSPGETRVRNDEQRLWHEDTARGTGVAR
ncbi:hypothetical protein NKH77_09250 [Streptomyces sp. M19]